MSWFNFTGVRKMTETYDVRDLAMHPIAQLYAQALSVCLLNLSCVPGHSAVSLSYLFLTLSLTDSYGCKGA